MYCETQPERAWAQQIITSAVILLSKLLFMACRCPPIVPPPTSQNTCPHVPVPASSRPRSTFSHSRVDKVLIRHDREINQKADPADVSIRSDEVLTLETSAFELKVSEGMYCETHPERAWAQQIITSAVILLVSSYSWHVGNIQEATDLRHCGGDKGVGTRVKRGREVYGRRGKEGGGKQVYQNGGRREK